MGIAAYLAEHDVRPGTNLAAKVTSAIDGSDALLVLITNNSVTAPYVHEEIGYALKGHKLIIPLVQPGVSHDKLAMLQGLEYIPFDFRRPYEGQAKLRAALQRLIQQQTVTEEKATAGRGAFELDAAVLVLACLALVFLALES